MIGTQPHPALSPNEHEIQSAYIEWTRVTSLALAELQMVYAVPNGGHRTKAEAGLLRAEGVAKGVPDVVLPVPRCGFVGLYMEFKEPRKGRVSADQAWWLEHLAWHGHCAVVVWSTEGAIRLTRAYLDGGYKRAETPCPFHVDAPRRLAA